MNLYTKTFVNPLLALAFKDGLEFAADPEYKVMEPKQEGPNKWIVIIEHDDGDDDDLEDAVIIHSTATESKTLKDYQKKLDNMKPMAAKSAPVKTTTPMQELVHLPVKAEDSKKKVPRYPITVSGNPNTSAEPEPLPPVPNVSDRWPCGKCIPCSQGDDCIVAINEALKAMPGFRGER
jgi:hypothetical protein